MNSEELFDSFDFQNFDYYSRTNSQKEVADLEDMGEGIIPLSQFIEFLRALYEEQGDDKEHTYLRSRDIGDGWYKCLSVVIQKPKSAEELEKIEQQRLAVLRAEEAREHRLYLQLKSKYEQ